MTTNRIFPPGSTIGILGAGQLGRMTAMAAAQLGYHVHIYAPDAEAPAAEVSAHHTRAEYGDETALAAFARAVDVVTYEFENVPAACPRFLAKHVPVFPSPDALEVCQHRLREKQLAQKLGIGTAPFHGVSSQAELNAAISEIGLPAVLKTCTMGYDGKGQWVLRDASSCGAFFAEAKNVTAGFGRDPATSRCDAQDDMILEGFVDFTMEISVIVARGQNGQMQCFPPVQNIHRDHILHQTIVPAPIAPELAAEAGRIARTLAEALDLVGVLAVEMFVTKAGDILVNELAPRPHNSGHWTLDACSASQFEQLVRAVCGLPLAVPVVCGSAVMTNLIGAEVNQASAWLEKPGAHLHLYGKKEAKPGRKMGHVTVVSG